MTLTAPNPDWEAAAREWFAACSFQTYLGIEIATLEVGHATAHLPFKPELDQQHGAFHAGAIFTLLDATAGLVAFSLAPPNANLVSSTASLQLLRRAETTTLIGVGQIVKPGRQLYYVESTAYAHDDPQRSRPLARAQITIATILK